MHRGSEVEALEAAWAGLWAAAPVVVTVVLMAKAEAPPAVKDKMVDLRAVAVVVAEWEAATLERPRYSQPHARRILR